MIPFEDSELLIPVENAINKVRPMLLRDNGNITLVKILNGKVYVKLEGDCQGCSASHNTLKFGVERQLKNDIHPEIEVIEVSP